MPGSLKTAVATVRQFGACTGLSPDAIDGTGGAGRWPTLSGWRERKSESFITALSLELTRVYVLSDQRARSLVQKVLSDFPRMVLE